MSNWRGFTFESKSYMSYEKMKPKEKVLFWLRFPIKWFIFQLLCIKDWLRNCSAS